MRNCSERNDAQNRKLPSVNIVIEETVFAYRKRFFTNKALYTPIA